jgi:hypothetical protein
MRRDLRRRKPTNAERRRQACDPDKEEGSPGAGVKSARKGTRPRPSAAKRHRAREWTCDGHLDVIYTYKAKREETCESGTG